MEERRKINKERRDKREKKLELQNELTFKQLHEKYIRHLSKLVNVVQNYCLQVSK
ncbi:hypothetical protein ACA351_11645 [Orientia tsutsugamushi]|uniref:hypothetical protein n=1 Tax=Orientia tsutsugamushi TaxID=784 RepID=UPI003528CE6D